MTTTPNKDTTMTPTPADIELPALPDNITSTAPARIWLDIGDAKDFIEPDDTFATLMRGEATWSEDNATGCGIEYVRADRARTAASCAGWLPIASAPKNKKLIAGYTNEWGNWRTVMACFYAAGTLEWHDDLGWDEDAEYAPEGWYEETETHEVVMPLETDPTHWQPSPRAPGAPATVRAERTDAATVADTLERFNRWRRDGDDVIEQPHPSAISEALDKAVAMLRADTPEGCTPADARKLREANHALATQNHDLLKALVDLEAMAERQRQQGYPFPDAQKRARAVIAAARAVPAPTAGDAGGAAPTGGQDEFDAWRQHG
jgi:hypothetical protein